MFSSTDHFKLSITEVPTRLVQKDESLTRFLRDQMGVEFAQFCGDTGRLLESGGLPMLMNASTRGEMARSVAVSRMSEILSDDNGILTLAIPLHNAEGDTIVAIRDFVSDDLASDDLAQVADAASIPVEELEAWVEAEEPWRAQPLLRLAETSRQLQASLQEATQFRLEAEQASESLAKSYEEISLLYAITQNLRLSNSERDLGDLALSWLHDCLPAESIAMVYLPLESNDNPAQFRDKRQIIVRGPCRLTADDVLNMVDYLELNEVSGPHVATTAITTEAGWPCKHVRQLLIAPKVGDHLFGWVAVVNHTESDEFDSAEASLLNTVCSILATHSGNHDLYRRQTSFLAAVVRSLTSAIDAKDPYTSGHSNRVARVAVRLGQELGCSDDELNTLYMGGLLHDIGKIGIDDNVLRKPGRLTDEEFDHIKKHPELGFKILEDIRELADVLPIVLHHHEQWDGGGYPHGLQGRETPWLARITAVSDAFDAMSSDRTYRKGMPIERVEAIFREGSGTQWDADVIRAYFSCRNEIHEIAREEQDMNSIDMPSWYRSDCVCDA